MASEALNFLTRTVSGETLPHVRGQIAALALARYTGQHLLARDPSLDTETRLTITLNNAENEQRVNTYQQLLVSLRLPISPINVSFLRMAAAALATHLIKGEYGHARMLEAEILDAEGDMADIWTMNALRRASASASHTTSTAVAA